MLIFAGMRNLTLPGTTYVPLPNPFAARHDCKNKTDKTKASYWSCRLPRYAKLLGLKSSFSGFW